MSPYGNARDRVRMFRGGLPRFDAKYRDAVLEALYFASHRGRVVRRLRLIRETYEPIRPIPRRRRADRGLPAGKRPSGQGAGPRGRFGSQPERRK